MQDPTSTPHTADGSHNRNCLGHSSSYLHDLVPSLEYDGEREFMHQSFAWANRNEPALLQCSSTPRV
ncbi:hypothetical protein BC939DRAFT_445398, partial [Gamsiella multidivaricata]|uniref:uncharacterized protein n=1 Tax=Gamsiella multidivaricata TaxID=101098 RepID=UPI0022203732